MGVVLRVELTPFLKWAGGKRWLVKDHISLFDVQFDRFVEPFLGSGAVYFKLLPCRAILSDKSIDLIRVYEAIRDNPKDVLRQLKVHHTKHTKSYYYKTRSTEENSNSAHAARFIYLNRTCWNGLYRVNLNGKFNVPIGTKSNVVLDTDDFVEVSKQLANVDLRACDFEETLGEASSGDFVFVDPPYTVKHNHNGFIKYNEGLFSWEDQVRLRDCVAEAVDRGAKVLVMNAHHESIKELYVGMGEHKKFSRNGVIAGDASARGKFEEIAIKCF